VFVFHLHGVLPFDRNPSHMAAVLAGISIPDSVRVQGIAALVVGAEQIAV
jgi:hypothetical protein